MAAFTVLGRRVTIAAALLFYSSIGTALPTSGVISVLGGEYRTLSDTHYGSVVLDSNSTLDCQGKTILKASLFETCYGKSCGISLGYSSNATIINCNIQGFYYGVHGADGRTVRIVSTNANNNTNGVFLENWRGLQGSDDASIENSTFASNRIGVYLSYSSRVVTSGCNFVLNDTAAVSRRGPGSGDGPGPGDNLFQYNSFSDNRRGLVITQSDNARIYYNTFSNTGALASTWEAGSSLIVNNSRWFDIYANDFFFDYWNSIQLTGADFGIIEGNRSFPVPQYGSYAVYQDAYSGGNQWIGNDWGARTYPAGLP